MKADKAKRKRKKPSLLAVRSNKKAFRVGEGFQYFKREKFNKRVQ